VDTELLRAVQVLGADSDCANSSELCRPMEQPAPEYVLCAYVSSQLCV
jgi:hypothetical protein